MCCEDIILEDWWRNVRFRDGVASFISEEAAVEFLAKGVDAVSEDLKEMYEVLKERREKIILV